MVLKGCYGFLKWIVFLFNLIFWLVGVGVLALALWILFDSNYFLPVAKDVDSYNAGTYTLLASGALMTIIGLLGCCGALRESQCLLGTLFVFLMILLVAEIAGGVWAYTNSEQLNKMISDSIQDTVRNYSKDKIKSNAFDLIQKELKCCGSEGYTSWSSSAYNGQQEGVSAMEIGISAVSPFNLPKSCCIEPDSDACEAARKRSILNQSAIDAIHSEGCTRKMEAVVQQYAKYVFSAAIAICIIELLGMIFSMLLCCAIRKIEDFKA